MRRAALLLLACVFATACDLSATAPSAQTPTPAPRKKTIDAAALREAFKKRPGYTYKVTYAVNGTRDRQAIAGRLVMYQVPPLRRIDATMGDGRDYQAFTLYIDERSIVACSLPFAPPCEPISAEEAATVALGVALLDAPLLENPQALDRAEVAEDRIAGQNVSCFLVREPGASKLQPGAELSACYNVEGILMRYGVITPQLTIEIDGLLLIRDFPVEDVKLPANAFLR